MSLLSGNLFILQIPDAGGAGLQNESLFLNPLAFPANSNLVHPASEGALLPA